MQTRKGSIEDLKKLNAPWAWNLEIPWQARAQKNTIQGLKDGTQEFLVTENGEEIIGELHIYWEMEDKDQANGENRAYLSALRLHP